MTQTGYPASLSGLVAVTYEGVEIGPTDAFAYAFMQSVLGALELAVEPFTERMRELGGYVTADVPLGFSEVNIEVHGLPSDLTESVLSQCMKHVSGEAEEIL